VSPDAAAIGTDAVTTLFWTPYQVMPSTVNFHHRFSGPTTLAKPSPKMNSSPLAANRARWIAIMPSTVPRLRRRTRVLSVVTGSSPQSEPGGVAEKLRDFDAADHVLAGHAGDVGARAADQRALDHGRAPTGLRQPPGEQLARRPTAQNQVLDTLGGAHGSRRRREASHGLLIVHCLWLACSKKNCGRRFTPKYN
jgi:hypothetical protein